MRICRRLAVGAALVVALAAPAAASAHGTAAFVASVRGITPTLPGVSARIERDGRLALTNRRGLTIVVLGPLGDPHLRFGHGGIAANVRRGRLPRWLDVASGRTFAWPDVRTTWEGPPPLAVRREPGKSHHVRDWRVPLVANGRSYAIVGSLDYEIGRTDIGELLFPLTPVPLLLLLAIGVVRRGRGR